jgi:hypothetical protein
MVAISGVVQNPNLYSVIGTTLTFSPAPPTGTNNIAVLYLGLPVIGSSSPGNTAFLSSTDLTATAGQTVFASAGSYTPGFVQVYRNGARLGNADFTATNGTTITLASAATAGDLVTIEYYTLTSLTNALPLTGGTVTGTVTFNSAITGAAATFSGIVAANGGGIQFPATQVTSADANTLDDYEEGTFSPTANGGTSGTGTPTDQRGNYVKIGGWVFVQLYIAFNKNTLLGNLEISNLPFTSKSTYYISTSCGYWTGLATAILNPTAYMGGGRSYFIVTKLTAASTNTNAPLTNTDLSASGNEFMFSLFYQV